MSDITIALDAGHGGSDPGAVYNGRMEKDDVLALTRAVGRILEDNGINVFYVRSSDEYETPFKKATDANEAGADYFISIHRNSSEEPNQYSGVESLVYKDSGIRSTIASNINENLANVGFKNLGITTRPNLVVLKRTSMPAVMVEVGFINSSTDNAILDNNFNKVAQAIADGILESIFSETSSTAVDGGAYGNSGANSNDYDGEYTCPCAKDDKLYRVQVGAYSNRENADRMLDSLVAEGFPAYILHQDNLYKVQVGAFSLLTNAIKMEQRLRKFRYNTYIVE
jgi:N-acetylmuramoyl-L-alanine amidase